MILTDLHVHSNYCDGKNSPEELVLSAIDKGLKKLGILVHSYVEFDKECGISPDREAEFILTVNELKEKFKGKIEILCGVEQDLYSTADTSRYDYVIGSMHYFKSNGKYFAIDQSEKIFCETVKELFNGDYYSAIEEYFLRLSEVVEKTNADIIGHLDLITKYNEGNKYFDTSNIRYVTAYKKAVDILVKHGKPFELNTGGIFRGYKSTPYPSPEIVEYVKSRGGKFILSSDSHNENSLAFQFDKWSKLL